MRDDDGPMLDYRSAEPHVPTSADDLGQTMLLIGRRLVFALGVGMFCGGVGCALSSRADAETLMGWGGGLVGLFIPLGKPGWDDRP